MDYTCCEINCANWSRGWFEIVTGPPAKPMRVMAEATRGLVQTYLGIAQSYMCCLVLSKATSLGSINNETEYIAKATVHFTSYLKRESWVLLGQEVPLHVLSNDNHLPIMKGLT